MTKGRRPDFQTIAKIGKAFSPGAPIDKESLFAGRTEQIRDVINAVQQRGQHVVLFGERGVGKTSLANVLMEFLAPLKIWRLGSGTINCDKLDTFDSVWRKVFSELRFESEKQKAGFAGEITKGIHTLAELLPEKGIGPDHVRSMLQRWGQSTIIVIDELDRIADRKTTTLIADTIKNLSDHSVDTTLVLVGVADSVDQLIREHASIERSLVQVRMPRMSVHELFEIIEKGLSTVQMSMVDPAKVETARLSQGLPHYTHLLSLHAAQSAAMDGRREVELHDVESAIRTAVEKANQSILGAYHKATVSQRKDALYAKVLLACALAPTDNLGYFAAADVRSPLSRIMGKPIDIPAYSRHLNEFCETDRGAILQKIGSARRYRFRFTNPMMQPFVVIHGRAKGLLPIDHGEVDPLTIPV